MTFEIKLIIIFILIINMKLAIILKNKLESVDTILPLAFSLKPNECIFFCQNEKHYNILKKNIFIFDQLKIIGDIKIISKKENFFLSKIFNLLFLFRLLGLFLNGYKIIHFGKLDRFPLNIFYLFFSSKIIFSQSNSYFDDRVDFKNILKNKFPQKKTSSKNVLVFNEQSEKIFSSKKTKNLFLTGAPRFYKDWQKNLFDQSKNYIKNFHPEINENEKFISFFISSLNHENFLDNRYYDEIIDDILSSINTLYPKIKILIKPHPTTRQYKLDQIINNKKYKNIILTYLQPNLILIRSLLSITELFGTVMIDANKLGITTVEYTKYDNETLNITNSNSLGDKHIDYFINFKKDDLKNILQKKITSKRKEISYLNTEFVKFINN